jgi:hypothetical protein
MMNWKGFGRKWSWHNQGNILAIAWRDWGKPQKTSVRLLTLWPRFKLSASEIHVSGITTMPNHPVPMSIIFTTFLEYKYKILCHDG